MANVNSQKIMLYNQSITNVIDNYQSFIDGVESEEIEGVRDKYAKTLAKKIVDECHFDQLKLDISVILSTIESVLEKSNIGCTNRLIKELYNVVYYMQRSKSNKDIIDTEERYSKKFIEEAMPSTVEYKEVNPAVSDQPSFANMGEKNSLVRKLTEDIYSKVVVANPDRFNNRNSDRHTIVRDREYAIDGALALYQKIDKIVEKEIESMQLEINNLELDYVYERIVDVGIILKTCLSSMVTTDQVREMFRRFDMNTNQKYQEILPNLDKPRGNLEQYRKAV